jgi:large subunit GTPase 1
MPDSVDPNTVMKSSTEPDNLADFLSTAELRNQDFESQKANTVVIESNAFVQVRHEPTQEQVAQQREFWSSLRVPRRPHWTRDMDADLLHQMERDSFLDWRRNLSQVEERESIHMTPFEKNLNVWRQLWRVVEMSDVLVQIVDARDPELFRCEDLERYTKEVGAEKMCLLLLNKADLLTLNQRRMWARYYESIGVRFYFFSAKQVEAPEAKPGDDESEEKSSYEELDPRDAPGYEEEDDSSSEEMREEPEAATGGPEDIVGRRALIDLLQKMKQEKHPGKERLSVGFCGYPNVGKSSTINKLMGEKKVTVSATPGKTKHFQSLFLEEDLCVLDW